MVDGVPGNDNLTTAYAQSTITIRDVNDSPPVFNKKEYEVSLVENTTPGTPLVLDMNVTDHDVVEYKLTPFIIFKTVCIIFRESTRNLLLA